MDQLGGIRRLILVLVLFNWSGFAQMPANTPTLNANARWVTDKGSQVFNVKAHGAKCDGVTDDSAAFAAARAAIPAGGGTLFIPPCATPYNLFFARLAITSSYIKVSGYGATLLYNVSDDCVTIGPVGGGSYNNNVVIEGLTLEPGAGSARPAGTSFTAAIHVGPRTNPMCVTYTTIN
jgi:hypothetical protein